MRASEAGAWARRLAAMAMWSLPALCSASGAALDVPAAHPRLWYGDAVRLQQAREWYAEHPFSIPTYPPSARARNLALRYLMTGDEDDCVPALDWLMRFSFTASDEDGDGQADPGSCDLDSEGRYCDRARWSGEDAILVYDWCHAEMSAQQRQTLSTRWTGYIEALNVGPYGWQERPINNYYWGYLRNSLLFGIAATGDTPQAADFIAHALDERFEEYFVPWAASFGRGGVTGEGTQYGPYPYGYSVIALQTARDFGYDPFARTSFFEDATYYLQYATSPKPTVDPSHNGAHFELFPFGDDESYDSGGSAESSYYADMLSATVMRAPQSDRARHARAWMQRTGVEPSWWLQAALGEDAGPADDADLPLDYLAHGYGFFYTRAGGGEEAMRVLFEMGAIGADGRGGTEHDGREAGSFQIWRDGRFVSRETVGYRESDYVRGFAGQGRSSVHEAIAHNTVLFEGRGQLGAFHAQPAIKRVHSAQDFAYAAVDLRPAYRSHAGAVPGSQCWLVEDDWPYADAVVRELVHLRGWDTVIVFDRVRGSADSLLPVYANPCVDEDFPARTAAQVRKTFVLHFPTTAAPQIVGSRVTGANGPQALDAHLVLPEAGTPRIVDERGCSGCGLGQYRLEHDQSGAAEGYFLNVLHSRPGSEQPLQVTLQQQGADWTLLLQRADGAQATIKLKAGMASSGGSVRFGNGAEQPFKADVHRMRILAQGPVWDLIPVDRIFGDGFEAQ